MLQLRNETAFAAERGILLDKDANQIWTVLLKATYKLSPEGSLSVAAEQEPVCRVPQYRGDPAHTSLVRECEMVFSHPGTGVILNGSAHAPGGEPVRVLDVSLRVGSLHKTLRVFGDRHWDRGLLRPRATPPTPFTTLPLTYERAYGGYASNEPTHFEPRNPAGRGFTLRVPENGLPLPNLEHPEHLISSWSDRPPPAGFGAIAAWWVPRSEYAGTCDQRWRERRMPLWPEDHDLRHHRSAPPELVSETPLPMGEHVELQNLTPSGVTRFRLPKVYPVVEAEVGRERYRQEVQLDRVIIEPDECKVLLVWRASLNCGRDARRVRQSLIRLKRVLS
ncbi:MAG: DUF2169 domain-containing protein [Hyalangium sp.]|uniref:DUF2169 family type VI secretion system accessory protein n=1 Tax=Hyalangium sp. TaxID=2028555 RepID=UPI00389A309E